jgi:hypothetical protein
LLKEVIYFKVFLGDVVVLYFLMLNIHPKKRRNLEWTFIANGLGRTRIGFHSILSYHVPSHNMLKWIILNQNLLYNYLEWHIYITTFSMVATSCISCFFFKNICCMHLLKSFFFLPIGSLLFYFIFDNIHGLSFHFDLYSVEMKTHFILKILRNLSLFFVYCNFVIIITISNMRRSLSSPVMHNNTETKYIILNC